jgi:hypothetical protein
MVNLQVESRHKEFLGVLCLHNYYTDKICRDLEFEPTVETSMVLRNYKLVFKPADFGFLILYTPDSSEERLRAMPPGTRLSFNIRCKNPRFMNFSQVPFWPEGVAFHYTNALDAHEDLKTEFTGDVYYYFKGLKVGDVRKKLLHLPEHVLLSKRSSRFNVGLGIDDPNEKGVSYDSIVIKDEFGSETLKNGQPLKKRFRDVQKDLLRRYVDHHTRNLSREGLSPSEKEKRVIEIFNQQEKELSAMAMSDHTIDLRHAPSGKYTVQFGSYKPMAVYLTEYPEAQTFGVLDIHLDTPKNALLNRDAKTLDEVVNPQLYHIHFDARSTYWRYIFVNYDNSKVTPKQVRDENNLIEFTEPVESRLEQVGTAIQYCQSETPVPLQDRPTQVLFLARMNGKRSMKEIRLPIPAADRVKPERTPGVDGEKIYSEVYVYL